MAPVLDVPGEGQQQQQQQQQRVALPQVSTLGKEAGLQSAARRCASRCCATGAQWSCSCAPGPGWGAECLGCLLAPK